MSCLVPNFTSKDKINIVVNSDDNVDSLVEKIMHKKLDFALSKEESLDPETWEESIGEYLNSIEKVLKDKGVESEIINEVKSNISTLILTNSLEVNDSEDNLAEIPDAELDTSKQKVEIKLNTLLRNIFGDDRVLTNNFLKLFKSEIFRRTIIQIGKGVDSSKIIYDVDTLNKAIILYESQLHNILYEYLKKYDLLPEGKKVKTLYDEDGNINPNYSKNLNAFQLYLNSLDNLQKRISTETYSGNKELLNAIHAFLTLQYFDLLMLQSVGKYLYINTKLTQPIVKVDGLVRYKYSINRKNVNLASGWQNEIRDGIDEIGSFSQLIIEQIPLIDSDSNLDKISTITAFLKLKYAISRLGDSSKIPNRIRIREAYKNLNKNTIGAWKEILSVLDNAKIDGNLKRELIKASVSDLREKVGLTDNDFKIFESVYEYFFNGTNGVYNIERLNEFNGGRSTYGITESLFATINSTTEANYLEMRLVDGKYLMRYKEKWNSRDRMFQLRKAINDSVYRKTDEHFLDNFDMSSPKGFVLFGDFLIDCSSRPSLGIFSPVTDYSSLKIIKDGKETNLNEYFKDELEEIYSEEGRKNIINNKDNKYIEFNNFLSLIDSKLGTKFLSETGLQLLRIYNLIWKSNYVGDSLQQLFITAARVAGSYYINNEFKKQKESDSELTSFDLLKYLKEHNPTSYPGLKLINEFDRSIVNRLEGGLFIAGVPNTSDVLDVISDAEAIFLGDNTKSVTRNLENNNIPNVSVNFTDIILEFLNQESDEDIPTSSLLFSGNNAYSIIDTVIDTDVETHNGTKSVDLFTTSELLYHSLVNKFIYGILNTGMFISQPTVYSDKKKFLNFVVNWKSIKLYKDFFQKGERKDVFKIPEQVHIDTILETLGKYYKTLFNKIANDYRVIFGINESDDLKVFLLANKEMKKLSKEYGKDAKKLFIKQATSKGIKVFEDLHYRNLSKKLISPNETLYHYATYIYTPEHLSNFLKELKIAYINQLLDNYVVISADSMIRDTLEKSGISNADWILDDLLVLAKVDGKNIISGDPIPSGANIELNPIINTYFYLHNVIDNNIKLGISGHELHHKIKSIGSVLKGTKIPAETYLDIEQSILDEANSIIGIENLEEIDNSINTINKLRNTLNNAYYTLISLAQNAQFKRTVPIPGTIRPFSQGTLKGIASTYDCAVVEDLKALTHDFLGNHGFEDDSSDVDAHDGSAWVDPFTSILENYSLEDSEGGEVKKPLWDIDEPEYGVRRLVKYASNTITNRIMLLSSKSSLIMYKLFKKMTNCRKLNDIDLVDDWFITGGYKSNSFTTNIINRENPLFYSHNGQYHQILNFGKEIVDGQKVYFTIEDDVDENGNTKGGEPYKVYHYFDADSNHYKIREGLKPPIPMHTINSLFELHAAMGGIESMSLRDGTLIESEASNRAVAHFMIYVSKPTEKYNELKGTNHYTKGAEITQEYFEQPLKTKLINCLINQSAIKNGASNINSVESLTDNSELLYDTYSTLKYGIQLDSDHTADEGKVTEMSQVISALDANGLYHDEVLEIYRVLGQQAIKAAQIEEDAIYSSYDKLYEVIGKTLVNNILRDERGLTRAILYQIRKNFGLSSNHNLDKIKIPFSDPSIYGKIMLTIGSILNKKSIKRKYPGMGLVMVPAFGIYLIWEIDGKKYLYKDLLKRAIEYNNELGEQGIPDTGDPIEFNNKIVDLYLNIVSPNKTLYDNNYVKNKESIELIYSRNPELSDIGTQEEYAEYLSLVYPNTTDKSIYWHGSDADFSRGFDSAKRIKGSGAPETKKRNDFYLARQAWSVLLYVSGVNRNSIDKNGFSHWNKLWWELKEIMSNGRRENNNWKDLVIGPDTVRQAIPNKKGVFDRDSNGENGKWLKERKADYGYENKSDQEFFEEILGIKWGEDTFNTWTERNREIFKSLLESTKGIYPTLINTTNPIRESGLDTYYEEHRGLMTKGDKNGNDAILSESADNEFGSDIAVMLNFSKDNIYFLGTLLDLENFKKWKENNNKKELNLTEIDPTNVLSVTYVDNKGNVLTRNVVLASIPDYYDFKENPIEFLKQKLNASLISNIEKNNKVPRDLAPTRIHFTYEYNGLLFTTNLFDTWIYKEMYQAMKLKKLNPLNAEYYDKVIKSYLKQIPGFLATLEKGIYVFKDGTRGIITQMSNLAAETIMSNVYKSRMGIKDGDEIPDINSPKYFRASISPLDSTVFDYDFQLITKNNNGNIYISLNPLSEDNENYLVKFLPWKTTNITKVKVNKTIDSSKVINRVYYIDNNNIRQFEIGRDLDVSDEIYYDEDTKSYKSIATDEVITGRKLFRETDENGETKILEYVEFLLKSEIKPKKGHSFIKYNIDLAKLNKVLLKLINPKTKKETSEKFNNALTNIIESLYKSDSFLILTPARRFKKENYNKIKTVLINLSERNKTNDLGEYFKNILNNVFTHNSSTIEGEGYINLDSGNTVKLNKEIEDLGIDRNGEYGNKLLTTLRRLVKSNPLLALNFLRIQDQYTKSKISYYDGLYLDKVSQKLYASFLKSLFFTSSRIPAQTLQSFMKMECIGFNGVDTNYCAVSHFLAFLLGSDYDIDKSYMMGLNFDNNGIYMGWSDLFNYNSLEEIEASEELPMPRGRKYINLELNKDFADTVITKEETSGILNESDNSIKIRNIAKLLKRLNNISSGNNNISVRFEDESVDGNSFVEMYLNRHELTKFGNNTDAVLKNYVSSNILKLIQKLGNLADAYTPVEMKALRDMLPYTPKQTLATSLTLFNPAMIPIMLNTNMTGKQGTGVAANGQKGLFMWRFGTLDTLKNNPNEKEFVTFNTTIDGVYGRFAYEEAKRKQKIEEQKEEAKRKIIEIPSLSATLILSLPDLGLYSDGLSVLHPNIKSDNIGSLYISAATDNAKELILAAINSGTKLMKCHLYLLSLGFDVNDIISFMTSPAVSFVDSISDDNIFNGTKIKINDAIEFAKKCIVELINYNNAKDLEEKNKIRETLSGYSLKGIRKSIIDSFKTKLSRVEDLDLFIKDLYSLEHILKGANEFSSFGTILGINLGIPQTKEDLIAWKNKLTTTISIAYSNLKLINKEGTPQYCEAVKLYFLKIHPEIFREGDLNNFNLGEAYALLGLEKGGKTEILKILALLFYEQYEDIINFNPDKWLDDLNYRNKTSEFYNLFKQSINIFYLIDHIPHFKNMFRIANILNKIDLKISLKSLISNYFNEQLKLKYPYAPNDFSNKLLPIIDEILIGHYIKSSGISMKLKESWKILDENYKETSGFPKLSLLTDHDISSFKYIFENYIIPELLNGTLLENSEDNEAVKNNEFIKNLMITSEKGKPLYKEDINLLLTDSNDEARRKYQTLLQGLKELKSYSYDNIPLIDLFMLYNIIVNKNRYGAERMTEIFEDFILDYDSDNLNSSFLTRYLINLGEEDYNKLLYDKIISSVTLTDLLLKAAPLLSTIDDNRLEPFIKILDPNLGYVFYEKTSNRYSRNPIDLLVPIPGELYNLAIERQVRFSEYEFGMVYSLYVSEIINNLMSDNFEYVLDLLMLNLTILQFTTCK